MSRAESPKKISPVSGSIPTAFPVSPETSWYFWYSAQTCFAFSVSSL
jgi:hypothetical protein